MDFVLALLSGKSTVLVFGLGSLSTKSTFEIFLIRKYQFKWKYTYIIWVKYQFSLIFKQNCVILLQIVFLSKNIAEMSVAHSGDIYRILFNQTFAN